MSKERLTSVVTVNLGVFTLIVVIMLLVRCDYLLLIVAGGCDS